MHDFHPAATEFARRIGGEQFAHRLSVLCICAEWWKGSAPSKSSRCGVPPRWKRMNASRETHCAAFTALRCSAGQGCERTNAGTGYGEKFRV